MEIYRDNNSDRENEISRYVCFSDSIDVRMGIQRGLNAFNMKCDFFIGVAKFSVVSLRYEREINMDICKTAVLFKFRIKES
jgi:hypothetical protein